MWKMQVPTLVTPGMISIGGSSGSAAMSRALNIAARNSSNSTIAQVLNETWEGLVGDGQGLVKKKENL